MGNSQQKLARLQRSRARVLVPSVSRPKMNFKLRKNTKSVGDKPINPPRRKPLAGAHKSLNRHQLLTLRKMANGTVISGHPVITLARLGYISRHDRDDVWRITDKGRKAVQ